MVSQELIRELQSICKDEFKLNLKMDEATELANTLVNYFEILIAIDCQKERNNKKSEIQTNRK